MRCKTGEQCNDATGFNVKEMSQFCDEKWDYIQITYRATALGIDVVRKYTVTCAVVTISIVVAVTVVFTAMHSSIDNGGLLTDGGYLKEPIMSHVINPKPIRNPQIAPYNRVVKYLPLNLFEINNTDIYLYISLFMRLPNTCDKKGVLNPNTV